jgi:hypothetical protein
MTKVLYCFANIFGLVDLRTPNHKDIGNLSKWFPDLAP